ncbi:MAG: rod-binding protein [Opitutaceae bacterium]|nr:rod-binding protein [Opitutaceae bacterium]
MSVAPLASVASAAAPSGFNAAAVRHADPAAQRTAVAQQFEAVLVRQLLGKSMNSLLGGAQGGVAGSVYGDMLTDTLAQQLTAGRGLGLGKMIEQQLTPRGERTAPPTVTQPSAPVADPAQ